MSSAGRRLVIAAIHYGEWEQSPGAQAMSCAEEAFAGWQCQTIEVVDQPPLTHAASVASLIAHRRRQRSLERLWRQYLTRASAFADFRSMLAQSGESLWLWVDPRLRHRTDRFRQIQAIVTSKHLQAMVRGRELQADWLLVLESDATLRPGSMEALASIANWLPSRDAWFIDLAGGLEHLTPQHKAVEYLSDISLRLLGDAVTNTACAYLMSSELVDYVVEYRRGHPASAELAIDWFLNKAFMDASQQGQRIRCARAEPRAFDHGSLTGVTRSWR